MEELTSLTRAKTRICIFGHPHVIKRLAAFWDLGAKLETESQILAFTRLCMEIREALGVKDKELLHGEVSQLLFDIRASEQGRN